MDDDAAPVRVAYLTTEYPSVSHTFIRRELQELERQVGEVSRFTVRESSYPLADPEDERERTRTTCLLGRPARAWAGALLRRGVPAPRRLVDATRRAIELGHRSHRGLPRHFAYLAEALLLLDECKARSIDHLHVHFGTNPAAVANLAHRLGGPPYSFTVHGPLELDAPISFALGKKIEDSAFVVAISDFCAGQLRRWVGPEHWDKIHVVRCTVGDEFFAASQPMPPSSKQLVCVGRLSAQKGQLLLVDGFADALEAGVDAELVLAGDGEMRPDIEALVARRGIADRVRITGWISEAQVRRELLASRCLVLPSFAEGLPMVIMEAFALGRPVLSTYVAGIPELVVDGDNGFLVVSGRQAAVRDGILRVMQTPVARLDEMAARGREAVRQRHYTPTETAKLVQAIEHSQGRAR